MKKTVFLLFLILIFYSQKIVAHPYHLSVTEININTEKKTIEVSCKMFTENLEEAIKKLYITNTDLKKNIDVKEVLGLVYKYVLAHLEISIDDIKQTLLFVGCENEEESTWCYLEGTFLPTQNKVSVVNTLFFDFMEEQTNMIHVYWNGVRKSAKLNNPDKFVAFVF